MPISTASITAALVSVSAIGLSIISPVTTLSAPLQVEHCAVEVVASPEESASGEGTVCFDTEAERDEYVLGKVTSPLLRAGSGTVKLGTAYKGTYLTGSSLAFWGTGTCATATYGFASLASDWVTGMRSITGSGCSVWVYSGANYGGTSLTCFSTCNTLGTLAGTAKSLVFRP